MLRPSIFSNHFAGDVFDDFFNDSFWQNAGTMGNLNAMKTDIRESDDSYQIDMELPGFKKEEVQAELKDGYLTIQAAHSDEKEQKDDNGRFIRRERYSGSYQRSFYVGKDVTQEDIKAKFVDGILNLVVPKVEKKPEVPEKKYISIEGE